MLFAPSCTVPLFLQCCFFLCFFPPEYKVALEYCGSHSGREVNKIEGAGITPVELEGHVAFEEANMIVTCSKLASIKLDESAIDRSLMNFYPQGDWHHMFIGQVEGVYIN